MNLTSERVDDRYLKILIVGETAITKVLRQLPAVLDSLQIAFEIDTDAISERDAVFHIEKEFLHRILPLIQGQPSTRRIFQETASQVFA